MFKYAFKISLLPDSAALSQLARATKSLVEAHSSRQRLNAAVEETVSGWPYAHQIRARHDKTSMAHKVLLHSVRFDMLEWAGAVQFSAEQFGALRDHFKPRTLSHELCDGMAIALQSMCASVLFEIDSLKGPSVTPATGGTPEGHTAH